ncbi:TolC family protein [uncultured Bacteroides sp.]|uniref:TolC family protein n=1 Tax=uncultured Bacteroides sp. TaxID=162156 RepID=UPI0037498E5E
MVLIVLVQLNVQAQDKQVYLSLNQAIDSAMLYNDALHQAALGARVAKEESLGANAVFMPQVGLSYSAYFTNNPLNAFGFALQEQSVTTGDFDPSKLNNPGFNKDFAAQVEVTQPLFNLDAVYLRSSARDYYQMQEWSHKRAQEYLTFQVKKAYLEINLAYQNRSVIGKSLETADAFLKRAEDMYEQGLIQKADLLEAKVFESKMKTDFQTAKSNIANVSDQLSFLMGKKLGDIYQVDTLRFSAESVKGLNLSYRTDILAYQAGLSAAKNKLQADKMSLIPRINAFGNYQFNDAKLFRFNSDSYFAGIRLSWKIFSGTQDWHKIKASRLERDKMVSRLNETKSQAEVEYKKNIRQLSDLNYEMKQAESMVEQAEEALTIQTDRYAQGLSSTSDLLRVQTQLAQTRLMREMVYFKKDLTIAYLAFINSSND